MKIGITGSRGFIGKNLVKAWAKDHQLSFFDKPKNDLSGPSSSALKKFVLENNVIVHAAAVNRGTDTEVIAGSVVATYNLIAAMEKYGSKAKIIYLSSIQAETETLYGRAKNLAEIMLEDFANRTGNRVAVFRLTNIFGEGCKPFYNSVVATFCHQVANGGELKVNGSAAFKFLYIGDLVKLLTKEANVRRRQPFCLQKISSENEIAIPELAKLIMSFKGKKPKLKNKFQKDLYKTYLSYEHGK